MIIVWMGVI